MTEPEPEDEMPARFVVGALGLIALVFLATNVFQGEITFRGNSLSRTDHPVGFWVMAAFMMLAALGLIYWAFHTRDETES